MNVDIKTMVSFNSSEILKHVEREQWKYLRNAGNTLRKKVSRSIKHSKDGQPSAPGEPIRSHPTVWKNDSNIKKAIRYAFDPDKKSVVVGPDFAQEVFYRNEGGGVAKYSNLRRKKRKINDVGVVEILRQPGPATRIIKQRHKDGRERGVPVRFGKIRNAKMLARVNKLEEELFGPLDGSVAAIYPARPTLQNALEGGEDILGQGLSAEIGRE